MGLVNPLLATPKGAGLDTAGDLRERRANKRDAKLALQSASFRMSECDKSGNHTQPH